MYVKRLNMSPNLSTQQHKVRAAEKEKKEVLTWVWKTIQGSKMTRSRVWKEKNLYLRKQANIGTVSPRLLWPRLSESSPRFFRVTLK